MLKALVAGVATYVPGMSAIHRRITTAPGTDSARYCYSVWMRHLVAACDMGVCSGVPRRVAELGPGESIGMGLAALLSGAESYVGLDLIPFPNLRRNLSVFDELVELFRARASIPGADEFPEAKPLLADHCFPAIIADIDLSEARIERIRQSIKSPNAPDSMIRYAAPWARTDIVERGSVDMIFSQAVMEHVDDLAEAYAAMHAWLSPEGFISHQIDLRSHGTAGTWDGHWGYSDPLWKLLRGKRAYLINRAAYSDHVRHLGAAGFAIMGDKLVQSAPSLERGSLAKRFAHMSDADRSTSGAFVLARAA